MSKYFYSPSLHTFLVDGIHPKRPGDSVPISYQDYSYLLAKQSEGLQIVFDSETKQPVARLAPRDQQARATAEPVPTEKQRDQYRV